MIEEEKINAILQMGVGRTNLGINEESKIISKALEKQIAKVPCYSGNGYYDGQLVLDTWECPCCGDEYEVDYEDYDYCPKCGQHIDYSTLTEED